MTRHLRLGLALFLLVPFAADGQDPPPPGTDIHLLEIRPGDREVPDLSTPRNITDREGYDNQPFFLPSGGGLLYTSIRPLGSASDGDDGEATQQADIMLYDPESGERRNLTASPESEYSPTPIHGGKAFSVIRVGADGRQLLWSYAVDGQGDPKLLLPNVEPVGYHAWADSDSPEDLVLFVLGEPHSLQRVTIGGKAEAAKARILAKDIGRSLHKIPGEDAFSFLHKTDDGWWIQRLSVDSDEITPLIRAFDGREDFAWSPSGKLWMADGSKLYRWCPMCGSRFQLVADLAEAGLRDITRLAVSPDGKQIAVVAERRVSDE